MVDKSVTTPEVEKAIREKLARWFENLRTVPFSGGDVAFLIRSAVLESHDA